MKTLAIVYDVDETLVKGDVPQYNLIPSFEMTTENFWDLCIKSRKETGGEDILTYMKMVIDISLQKRIKLTKEFLERCGHGCHTFPGVDTWFDEINNYGHSLGVNIEHYVISVGLEEMIMGTDFAKNMTKIFASSFMYDHNGIAIWPKNVVNYTTKTQYLFRISKGCVGDINSQDVNMRQNHHPIPFKNMIYIGDGLSDVPCMAILMERGGLSIAVYDDKKMKKRTLANMLMDDGRVSVACPADYRNDKYLFQIIKGRIEHISKL